MGNIIKVTVLLIFTGFMQHVKGYMTCTIPNDPEQHMDQTRIRIRVGCINSQTSDYRCFTSIENSLPYEYMAKIEKHYGCVNTEECGNFNEGMECTLPTSSTTLGPDITQRSNGISIITSQSSITLESGTTSTPGTTPEPGKPTTPEPSRTPEPSTTTPEPITTTPETSTTTPEPSTTTPEPSTTTPEPSTTTPEPSTTTPEPITTTPETSTTTPEPSTTTPEPSTTTPEPSTTTPEPSTTTPEPSTAPAEPSTTATRACYDLLGMQDGSIPDENIKASSIYDESSDYLPKQARLDGDEGSIWMAAKNDLAPWIQADIGYQTSVSGVITQGNAGFDGRDIWVTTLKVSTFLCSTGDPEVFIKDGNGAVKIFDANTDINTQVTMQFDEVITAQIVRLCPLTREDEGAD